MATVLNSTAQILGSIGKFYRWRVMQLDFSLKEFVKDGDSREVLSQDHTESGDPDPEEGPKAG